MSSFSIKKNMFCVYLTTYVGNKLPMFYIGSSQLCRIEKGYRGSVLSKKYKKIWKQELKENPHLFKIKIISTHKTDREAREKELFFQKSLGVVKSEMYINMSCATVNGYFGADFSKENSPRWKVRHTTESREKISRNHTNVKGEKNPMFGRLGKNNPKSLTFIAISPIGKMYKEVGISDFCRKHNLHSSNVVNVLQGKRPHTKGWKFKYS